MAAAPEKFLELESRIIRTIELLKTTRQEKDNVEKQLAAARNEISRLGRELEELRDERDIVKNKIESLLETLSELTEESIV
jgi:septal ring factor EnvC (AmiA/AmiB activator)